MCVSSLFSLVTNLETYSDIKTEYTHLKCSLKRRVQRLLSLPSNLWDFFCFFQYWVLLQCTLFELCKRNQNPNSIWLCTAQLLCFINKMNNFKLDLTSLTRCRMPLASFSFDFMMFNVFSLVKNRWHFFAVFVVKCLFVANRLHYIIFCYIHYMHAGPSFFQSLIC